MTAIITEWICWGYSKPEISLQFSCSGNRKWANYSYIIFSELKMGEYAASAVFRREREKKEVKRNKR